MDFPQSARCLPSQRSECCREEDTLLYIQGHGHWDVQNLINTVLAVLYLSYTFRTLHTHRYLLHAWAYARNFNLVNRACMKSTRMCAPRCNRQSATWVPFKNTTWRYGLFIAFMAFFSSAKQQFYQFLSYHCGGLLVLDYNWAICERNHDSLILSYGA